ncbi:hypothetical protein GX586_01610 [bacterium]|nr:hypothetical protein [bacterium]
MPGHAAGSDGCGIDAKRGHFGARLLHWSMNELILGIWDGHDAGAALVRDGVILAAINEERLTGRKHAGGFPARSIHACLRIAGVAPGDVSLVAASTTDAAKTLTRWAPTLRDQYYALRRRKCRPGMLARWKKMAKYEITLVPGNALTRRLSDARIRRQAAHMGLDAPVAWTGHHEAHAASAALCSGFDAATVVTLDGIGDALSGSVSIWRDGTLRRLSAIAGRDSMGIFFEHVTNLLNMRELEDEGKVMALANYAFPVPDDENPLLDLLTVEGTDVRCVHGPVRLYRLLADVLYRFPSEQFAYMAQRVLELRIPALVSNAVKAAGCPRVCLAGGVASNVKANMLVRGLPCVEDLFVFPHMGDGGLAVGAALAAGNERFNWKGVALADVALGPAYGDGEIADALNAAGLPHRRSTALAAEVAEAIHLGAIILWFQGRTEYGPRSLGNRSILARPDEPGIRDRLNLALKQRVWYQPFCPSILESDAPRFLAGYRAPNRFMTEAFRTTRDGAHALAAAMSIDGTCRPQIVADGSGPFATLLAAVRRSTGIGAVLNTSMNIHGEPMVNSPAEAVSVFQRSGADILAIGPFIVRKS